MSIKRKEFISIVIPAYDESSRILATLALLSDYLSEHFKNHEIIVVNDGSRDDTVGVVLKVQKEKNSLKLISYKINRGKGYAIRKGIGSSKGDVILISDADLSTPIDEVEKLLIEFNNGYDVVIGSRALEGSNIVVRQPWWREFMGKTFNRFVRLTLLKEFMDTQCGFKLFKGDVARAIFKRATIDRFAYDVEVLYLAGRAGYKIKEVPIRWVNSPHSKVKPVKDSMEMLKDLIRIRLRGKN